MAYPLSYEKFMDILEEVFSLIFQNPQDLPSKESEIIKEIKSYLLNNYCRDITLDEIARKFSYTPSHIIKMFKKETGDTPMKYIINLRISTAKSLLRDDPKMDIKQISESVGYYDQHYFSRIFKSITGSSPSDYRQTGSVL